MIEKKRTKPLFKDLISLTDFRFYCERQYLTDTAILDNDPRFPPRYVDRHNQVRQEIAEMTNELKFSAKWWAKNKQDDRRKVVTEFIDALHFYCGTVVEEMIKERHFEHERFERDTARAYETWEQLYNFSSLEEAGLYSYAEEDALRRHLIDSAFNVFHKSPAHCMAVGLKIVTTFDVTANELLAAYMDKNEIVHARNEQGY